ncbi:hypothetical protein TRFO_08124 [Tritrichomonas foetus]|uniref:Rab-GAP TBC domain-containing protein n=1 Tax=Tritrichomonas foetus TaxID=1144522 RepID=A0A1J4JM04_9EUKA|nr:hypothetical protein TRFO_08124 [Tritrichomonas foetus]|eukprot:OHT00127.1 hypothetical protein TRFO_08124 [Tritrichomonas foetus]
MMFQEGSSIYSSAKDHEHLVASIAQKISAKAILNQQNLIDLMTQHYCYPIQHRVVVWRYLLQLPMNETQYAILASQPLHPQIRRLPNKLPIRFSNVSHRLVRLLSVLTYWHPPLAECDWLPSLCFPFLKMFERDSLTTFEVMATIICNWCTEWLQFTPNPPITTLSRIEHMAKQRGKSAPQEVVWPALRSFFSEVATTEACLMLIDNILSAKPNYLDYLILSYAMRPNRRIDELNVHAIIKKARLMYEKDSSKNPNQNNFIHLPTGFYPVLHIVRKSTNWKVKELERIRSEAEAAKLEMNLQYDIEAETKKLERRRKNWMAEREVLIEIENEQMAEFRRKEKENLLVENRQEEMALEKRRKQIETRRISEENSINEWRNDCKRLQEEMTTVAENRKETWDKWLKIREDSGRIAKDEIDNEVSLLKSRERIMKDELQRHNEIMNHVLDGEQSMLRTAITRSQEIDDDKFALKEVLEKARRRLATDFQKKANKEVS